jgi:hypothetical protein
VTTTKKLEWTPTEGANRIYIALHASQTTCMFQSLLAETRSFHATSNLLNMTSRASEPKGRDTLPVKTGRLDGRQTGARFFAPVLMGRQDG